MSQSQFDTSSVANGTVALNNDLMLVDAAINLANGHMNCDNRVGHNLVAAAAAATLMAASPPSSAHSEQHPGFPGQNDSNTLSLMAMNDSNNNSLGSNGSLNGSTIGSNKPLYGHLMNGAGGGGSINMAIGGQNLEGLTGSSSGSPSPLMMKPPMNMQFYQQQWQQQQYHPNRQQHQMQYLHGLQEHRLQQQHQHNVSKGANSPNASSALNGECCPMTNSVLNILCILITTSPHHHYQHHQILVIEQNKN